MFSPAGDGIRTSGQALSVEALPRHQQAAWLAVADQANHGGARVGTQGCTHLVDHILPGSQQHHAGADELLRRHGAGDLGADQHQLDGMIQPLNSAA